ncbi:2'-5' RNA ligase family protein [Streptomyces luteogriseus]|uniref:2'-5' RNA ligase family protein n=1 Tax=Streptomyces luteogriseus TaxID=68233 RepID=UPI00378F701F
MKRFVPVFRNKPWESGVSVLHLYVVPDPAVDKALFALIAACRTVLQDYPVWCLPDDRIHITVEMDAAAPSEQITQAQRAQLISELEARLAGIDPFTVLCGSPIANRSGALLDTYPDHQLTALQNLARAALWEVHDAPAISHDGGRGHMSLGYAFDEADSDPLQSALRRITPSHAPLTVSRLHLLDVRWTAHPRPDGGVRWEMTWELLAAIPLGKP